MSKRKRETPPTPLLPNHVAYAARTRPVTLAQVPIVTRGFLRGRAAGASASTTFDAILAQTRAMIKNASTSLGVVP